MISKSSTRIALLFASIALTCASLPPFDLIDNYVQQFQSRLNELTKLAEEYRYESAQVHQQILENKEEVVELAEATEYDFIIIGAGTSGAVIANRLSEEPGWKILLLEAGEDENAYTQIPSVHPQIMNTPYTWGYDTVPQNTTCLAKEGQKCPIRRGKVIGGDTSVNDMLYTRGHPRDYDNWSDAGLKGWCWDSLEPYFRKIESACLKHMDKKHRHYGGPVHLENSRYPTQIGEHLWASCEGTFKKIDYNGKEHLGFGQPQVITKDGKRHSVAKAYLDRAFERDNLEVSTKSHVIKILIGDHTKEAVGVKYLKDGKVIVAKAKKEIILAAGPINSPHILLLSGVGPEEDLAPLKIPVLAELPVGRYLKDHIVFTLDFSHNSSQKEYHEHTNDDILQYLKDGEGPLVSNGLELVGFIKTKISRISNYPDIEVIIRREHFRPGCNYWNLIGVRADYVNNDLCEIENKLSVDIILLHPKSKGYLKLVSSDPFDLPLINPHGLSDEDDEDIDTLAAGVQEVLKFAQSESLVKSGIKFHHNPIPECDQQLNYLDDNYWKCAIRYWSNYKGEIIGTAKMGVDKHAVVDNELKVLGVSNLRVADASVIPVTISGNLMAPEIVIGEKASDLIKDEWLHKKD